MDIDLDHSRTAFLDALRAGDATAIGLAYATEATLVAPGAEIVRGRAAIQRFWQTGVDIGIGGLVLAVMDLHVVGNLALEAGRYAMQPPDDARTGAGSEGSYLAVHRVEPDGRWRRIAEMLSPDPPAGTLAR